jgi:hypothetical protein
MEQIQRVEFDPIDHRYTVVDTGKCAASVTEILMDSGVVESEWYTDESRERGRAVHAATEYSDQDDLDESSVADTILPYIQAAHRCKKESGFVNVLVEPYGYHPIHRYAGKPDRIIILNGYLCVLDYKSGAMMPWTALQTAAYEELMPYLVMPDGRLFREVMNDFPFIKGVRRYGCELRADATYRLKRFDDPNDFRVFLGCQAIHNWKQGK